MTQHEIVIIGAGTMGRGIAHIAALHGHQVTLCDRSEELAKDGIHDIEKRLSKSIEKGKLDSEQKSATLARLRTSGSLPEAVKTADWVIEAIPEILDLKITILRQIEKSAPSQAIIGSNTSSLSMTALAAALENPKRFIGTHFFNPPHIMTLLELVVAEQTSTQTLEAAKQFADSLKRDTIIVQDNPGFATSRLGLVIGLEAIRMLQEGVASAADIDRAMEMGYRHPMGPLKLTDLVGLDVRLAIAENLHQEIGEQFRPPHLLRKMVRAGKLGKKAGKGFYDWSKS
ncbi:MAG: 3-hydroxyacyl-CoA dehydrogenase family protein [Myxococcota bacterium]|nr:3-hydroxyacyl-CoA dehydrogenase family protein [Myxococcota bacterium]